MWHQKPKGSFEKKEVANPVCFLRKAGKIRGESNASAGFAKRELQKTPGRAGISVGRARREETQEGRAMV